MKNERLETLGARIKEAICKVEELQAQLNKRLKELEEGEKQMEATYRFTDEVTCGGPNTTKCRVYCPHTNNCYDLFACSFCKYQDDLIIKTEDPWYTPSGDEDIADDPFEYDPDYSPLIDRDAYTF